MRRTRSADEARLRTVHENNAADLLRFIGRRVDDPEDAADVLAETFLVAWRKIARLPADDREARMWMFGIAKLTLANWVRSARRRNSLANSLRLAVVAADSHREPTAAGVLDVRAAIAALPSQPRELVVLVHWDGFSIADAGIVLGVSEPTARSRYQRAKRSLREALQEDVVPALAR